VGEIQPNIILAVKVGQNLCINSVYYGFELG